MNNGQREGRAKLLLSCLLGKIRFGKSFTLPNKETLNSKNYS
jgi:hypothetical protein